MSPPSAFVSALLVTTLSSPLATCLPAKTGYDVVIDVREEVDKLEGEEEEEMVVQALDETNMRVVVVARTSEEVDERFQVRINSSDVSSSSSFFRLDLRPTGRHSRVSSSSPSAGAASWHSHRHLGILALAGKAELLLSPGNGGEDEVLVGEGTAAVVMDVDDYTFTGTYTIGSHVYVVRERLIGKMVLVRRGTTVLDEGAEQALEEGDGTREDEAGGGSSDTAASNNGRISGHLPRGHVCEMKVAVDNELFHFWHRDLKAVTKQAIAMLESANRIYRDRGPLLNSGRGLSPVQFHIRDLFVATDEYCAYSLHDFRCSTCTPANLYDFSQGRLLDHILLTEIGTSEDSSAYCLSFLLTGCSHGSVLGISFVSGACADRGHVSDVVSNINLNIGFVAVHNSSYASAEWIVAHELGHTLGAQHYNKTLGEGSHLMNPQVPETINRTMEVFSQQSLDLMNENFYNVSQRFPFRYPNKRGTMDYLPRQWCFINDKDEQATDVKTLRRPSRTLDTKVQSPVIPGSFVYLFGLAMVSVAGIFLAVVACKNSKEKQSRRGQWEQQQQQRQQRNRLDVWTVDSAGTVRIERDDRPRPSPAGSQQRGIFSEVKRKGEAISCTLVKKLSTVIPYKKMNEEEGEESQ